MRRLRRRARGQVGAPMSAVSPPTDPASSRPTTTQGPAHARTTPGGRKSHGTTRRRPRGPRGHRPRYRHRHPDRHGRGGHRSQSGRDPTSRATSILGAAFAEGLGVLAIVVGILALFLEVSLSRMPPPWNLSPSSALACRVLGLPPNASAELPDQSVLVHRRLGSTSWCSSSSSTCFRLKRRADARDRRERIAQGLKDAEQARRDRANAEKDRTETLAEARRESREILDRAQKVAQESREADIAATKAELERLREQATAEIEAEKVRAIAELRPRSPTWPSPRRQDRSAKR